MEGTYPPFNLRDEQGSIAGIEHDLLEAIAKKQGFNVNFIPHPWDGLFETLNGKQSDIVTSGAFLTPERVQKYQAIRPYMKSQLGAYVKADNAAINSIGDLSGKKVSGQSDTVAFDESLKKDIMKGSGEAVGFPTHFLAVQSLVTGKVDAVFGEGAVLKHTVMGLPSNIDKKGYKFIPYDEPNPRYIGFFIKKGRNDELAKKLNDGLQQIADDGTYAKIMEKWTGDKNSTLPPADVLKTIEVAAPQP